MIAVQIAVIKYRSYSMESLYLVYFSITSSLMRRDSTYHAFVKSQGATYIAPDVAVAFNTGCGAGLNMHSITDQLLDTTTTSSTWRETEQILVRSRVPTLFTVRHSFKAIS